MDNKSCIKELKAIMAIKADKLSMASKLGITSLIVTTILFIGGGPLMYSISAAKDKENKINLNKQEIQMYSIKQDVIIDNQREFKEEIKELNNKREQDQKELNIKLESILKAIRENQGKP